MNIEALCQRTLVTIDQSAPLAEAARRMRQAHVGALVVTAEADGHPQVLGLLTDRDIVVEGLARDADPARLTAGALASRKLVVVAAESDVAEAVVRLREGGVRRLLVVKAPDNRLIGLVALEELLEALVGDLTTLAAALRGDIAREQAERPPITAGADARPVFLPAGTPGMPWPGRPVIGPAAAAAPA
jgi:CBS domain-containing protein